MKISYWTLLPDSLTIVDGMVQEKTSERKKLFLDGLSDEIEEKLSEILFEIMQQYP